MRALTILVSSLALVADATAQEPVELGATTRGFLIASSAEGERPRYTFRATEEGLYTVWLESREFDARLEVLDADGVLVGGADEGGIGADARISFASKEDVAYIVVPGAADGMSGSFSLRVLAGDVAPPTGWTRLEAELEYWASAARIAQRKQQDGRALSAFMKAGELGIELGQHQFARSSFEEAVAFAEALGDQERLLEARVSLGSSLAATGQWDDAEELLSDLRGSLDADAEPRFTHRVLQALGDVHRARGWHESALGLYEELIDGASRAGDEQAAVRGNMRAARIREELGEPDAAEATYRAALDQAVKLGRRSLIGEARAELGWHLARSGNDEEARVELRRALTDHWDNRLEVAITLALGEIELRGDDPVAAFSTLRSAVLSSLRFAEAANETRARIALGEAALALGEAPMAAEQFEEATARANDPLTLARAVSGLALADELLGDHAARLAHLEAARGLYARLGSESDGSLRNLIELARWHEEADELDQALELNIEARNSITSRSIETLVRHAESQWAQLLVRTGDFDGAMDLARGVLSGLDRELSPGDPALLPLIEVFPVAPEESSLHAVLTEFVLGRDDSPWNNRMREAVQDRAMARAAKAGTPEERRAAIRSAFDQALTWDMIRLDSLRGPLGEDGALLHFASGRTNLYAYLLTSDELRAFDLGRKTPIERDSVRFVTLCSDPDSDSDALVELGHSLHDRLVASVLKGRSTEIRRLVIVPSLTLGALPFEALIVEATRDGPEYQAGGVRFLVEGLETVVIPSVAWLAPRPVGDFAEDELALILSDARPRGGDVADLIVAGVKDFDLVLETARRRAAESRARMSRARLSTFPPYLEDSYSEAYAVRQALAPGGWPFDFDVWKGVSFPDGKRSTGRMLGQLRDHRILHWIVPTVIGATGDAQGLWLPDDNGAYGLMKLSRVRSLELRADLVALPACELARAPARAGRGLVSLADAFLTAGARGVLCVTWLDPELEPVKFFAEVYAGWLGEDLTPFAATRRAQSGFIDAARLKAPESEFFGPLGTAHPFHWAGFRYFGAP